MSSKGATKMVDAMVKAIGDVSQNIVDNADFAYICKGTITSVLSGNTYKVTLQNGTEITAPSLSSDSFAIKDVVIIIIENNTTRQYIIGKISVSKSSGGTSTGDMLQKNYDSNGDNVVDASDVATKLKTARKINNVDFDGTQDITIYDSTKSPLRSSSVSISGATTLDLTHAGKRIFANSTSAFNIVIPTNASVPFTIGDEIEIIQYGSAKITLVPSSGVTIRSYSGYLVTSGQYAAVSLIKIGTDEWIAIGNLSAS